jgi:EpsI family protein
VQTQNKLVVALVVALVMALASALAIYLKPSNYLADRYAKQKLADIVPTQFGPWTVDKSVVPVAASPDLQAVLDATYDEVLAVTYRDTEGRRIMLSMAYGRNQHRGMNTHRPEVCYPAQGFRIVKPGFETSVPVQGADGKAFKVPVTRVVAAYGPRNEPISYWLRVDNQITSFGYSQRWANIKRGLQGDIPDGVLVRVSSIDRQNEAAFALQDRFIQDLLSAVAPISLPRLVGDVSRLP